MKFVNLEVLAELEADKKQDVLSVSTSRGYQLLQEKLIHPSEYEDADLMKTHCSSNKIRCPSLSQIFKHCVEAKKMDEKDRNYERVFVCQPKTNISFA